MTAPTLDDIAAAQRAQNQAGGGWGTVYPPGAATPGGFGTAGGFGAPGAFGTAPPPVPPGMMPPPVPPGMVPPPRSRGTILGWVAALVAVAVGLFWLGTRGDSASDGAARSTSARPGATATATSIPGPALATPWIPIGGRCPDPVTQTVGAPTRLEHRYLSTTKHALVCTNGDGTYWLYLEDRTNTADHTVTAAMASGDGYTASDAVTRIDVSYDGGLRRQTNGTISLNEPIVLERSPGSNAGTETERTR